MRARRHNQLPSVVPCSIPGRIPKHGGEFPISVACHLPLVLTAAGCNCRGFACNAICCRQPTPASREIWLLSRTMCECVEPDGRTVLFAIVIRVAPRCDLNPDADSWRNYNFKNHPSRDDRKMTRTTTTTMMPWRSVVEWLCFIDIAPHSRQLTRGGRTAKHGLISSHAETISNDARSTVIFVDLQNWIDLRIS